MSLVGCSLLRHTDLVAAMREPYSISLYPGSGTADGRLGDHILLAPAYNVTAADVEYIVETTIAVIKQFFRKYASGLPMSA